MSRDGKPISSDQIKKASPSFRCQCGEVLLQVAQTMRDTNRWICLSPAGDWQARLWHSHHYSWTCTERRNALRLRQNPGKCLNKTPNIKDGVQLYHCLSSPHTHTHLMIWLCVCHPGQQDGRGGGHGAAGGHSGHSCLCGQPVREPGSPTATHGMCASGTSLFNPPGFSHCTVLGLLWGISSSFSACHSPRYRPKMWLLPWLRADLRMPSSLEESEYFPLNVDECNRSEQFNWSTKLSSTSPRSTMKPGVWQQNNYRPLPCLIMQKLIDLIIFLFWVYDASFKINLN